MSESNYGALDAEIDAAIAEPTVWGAKDGREILISDMTDSHLLNSIRFLRRRADVYRRVVEELDELDDDDAVVASVVPEFVSLMREADRRQLNTEAE